MVVFNNQIKEKFSFKNKKNALILVIVIIVFSSIFLISKNIKSNNNSAKAQNSFAPIPVKMQVINFQKADIWKTYPARLQAVNYAQIRPQVSGQIEEIHLKAGQMVKKGDLLITIDPKPLQDQYHIAKADLQIAQSALDLASKNYERSKTLIKTNAISKKVFDERQTNYQNTVLALELSKAVVNQAKTNLQYAYIKAPFSGLISRAEITKGNLVQAGANAPILFSILSDEGMYVDFDVNEADYLSLKTTSNNIYDTIIEIEVPSLNNIKIQGKLLHFDNKIDSNAGTIRARGLVKDNKNAILPGMFVNASLMVGKNQDHIIVPQSAIGVDQDRRFVWVVNGDNKAKYRQIKLGTLVEGGRIIMDGLKKGEKIIIDGLIKIRPDTIVTQIKS